MFGYKVQVEGEYFARSGVMGSERVLKNYAVEVNLSTMDRALSIIKGKLLKPALGVKYKDDFIAPRTINITRIEPLDEASRKALKNIPVSFMDRDTLVNYIEEHNLPVDVSLYPELFKLREAAEQAKIDPERFAKKQELNRADLSQNLILAKLNPGLFPADTEAAQVPAMPSGFKSANPAATKALDRQSAAKQVGDRVEGLRAAQVREGEMKNMEPDVNDI